MAITVAAVIVSVLAMELGNFSVSAECLDTESEEFRDLKARMTLMNRKMQEFVTYQIKFRNLERKVLVREQSAARFERRLKTTESELDGVKLELERRQRGETESSSSTGDASIRERSGALEDSLDVEEWLRRERVERQIQEAKLQTKVEKLMQTEEEVRRKLDNATDNVQKIRSKVSVLENGTLKLGNDLDEMRRTLEIFANASEGRKGPPLSAEQSRSKLNEFLKDVEELNLFEAAENHSHLMESVGQLSQRLGKLNELTESTRQEMGVLSLNSKDLLTTVTALQQDIDFIRDVVEKEKPWEDYTIREMGSLEERMKLEISNIENATELFCKVEAFDLKEQIENVSTSVLQLQSRFGETEATRKRQQEFRKNFLKQIDQNNNGRESPMSQDTITIGLTSKSPGSSEDTIIVQPSQRMSAIENIRRLPGPT